jgi:uncharacterized protein YhjY with autotransporter beta-barrel domain
MLDPFVDGRSGASSGGAIGFAPAREELPDDIALAYAKLLKEPPAPSLPSPASGGGLGWGQPWSVWGAGYGGSNRTSGDPAVVGSHDLSAVTAGGAAGLDYRLAPGTVVGFALAGGGTNWGLAEGIGTGKSDAFQAGVYGTTRSGPAYLAAALAFTNHWMSTDRFAFAGDHLTASFNAQSFGGRVEGGYRIATIYGGLTPYAAIQAQNFRTPSYSEADLTSGGFALGFNSRNATDTRSELGGRFDRLLLLNPEAALTLRTRVAWAHDWISDPSLAALFQTLPGASFIVNGATPAKNSARVGGNPPDDRTLSNGGEREHAMTLPNWVVPGFTLVYTTAFGTAIQNSAVTGTWILDALTVSPSSVTVSYSARSTGNIESLAGQYTFAPGSAAAFGYQFWVDPTSTAAAIASIRGPEGETYSVAGTETYDGVNATVLSFSGPTASSVVIYQTSTGLILHESASYPNSAEILEFSTVLNSPPPPPPAPNPAPPAGTTADMILRNASGTFPIDTPCYGDENANLHLHHPRRPLGHQRHRCLGHQRHGPDRWDL